MNYLIFTILTGINTTANLVILFYFIAILIAFKELDFSNIKTIHYWIIGISLALILIIPEDDLLRVIFSLPPEPIK